MKAGWLYSRRFWLLVLGGVLLVLLGSRLPLAAWLAEIKGWLVTLGPWAVPAYILIYLLATVLGLPNILLILIGGTLFGFVKGVISVSIADTLGAIACYLLGRTIGREQIKRLISKYPNLAQLDKAVGKKGWKILLLTRLSPLVPSNILNYGFSCTKVNFWQYCFFSWLGMLPVIAIYVYLGSLGNRLTNGGLTPQTIVLQAIGVVLTVGAAFYTTRLTKKALATECPPEAAPSEVPRSKATRS